MPNEVSQNQNNFFPATVPGLQERTNLTYLNSPFPPVLIDSAEISNDIETVGAQSAQETITVTVQASVGEAILSSLVDQKEFTRWYDTANYIKNMRVRLIACFGEGGNELDFIAQRINEYQADIMTIKGETDADDFYFQLTNALGPDNFPLLSPSGPFGANKILESIKNNAGDKIYYSNRSKNRDIILYDIPLDNAIQRGDDGKASLNKLTTLVRKNTNAPAADILQNYVLQKVLLNPFVFKLGASEQYTNTNLSEIRFYAFTYMDNKSFLEGKNISISSSPGTEDILLETGLSFIRKAIFKGVDYNYKAQEHSSLVTGDFIDTEINPSPIAKKLTDVRSYQSLQMIDTKRVLNNTVDRVIKNMNQGVKTSDIIKNDNFFSELWITRCEDDNARFGFVFDKAAFLSEKSDLPFLYENPATAADLINGGGDFELEEHETAKCLDVIMSKRQVKEQGTLGVNDLTFARQKTEESYYRPEEIIPSPISLESMAATLSPTFPKRMTFYEGYDTYEDKLKTQTGGVFQYAASFSVYDPSFRYLQKFARRLSSISSRAYGAYDMIVNSPPSSFEQGDATRLVSDGAGLYDVKNNERLVPLSSILFNGVLLLEVLVKDIEEYVNLFTKLSGPIALSNNALNTMFLSIVKKKNPYGIKDFADTVESFKRSLEQVLESKSPKDPHGESTMSPQKIGMNSKQKNINILTTKKYFDELFDFGKEFGTGYLYLSDQPAGDIDNPGGLPTFSKSSFESRRSEEFNKYFANYVEPGSPSQTAITDNTPYDLPSFQYFSPKAIKIFGKPILVQTNYKSTEQNIVSYDLDRYAEMFSDIIKKQHLSNKGDIHFVSLENQDTSTRGVFNSVNDSLFGHGCQISEGTEQLFTIPSPGEKNRRTIKVGTSELGEKLDSSPRAIAAILGGEFDTDEEAIKFLNKTEKQVNPSSTGSYGAIVDPESIDMSADLASPSGLPPLKLSFAILGELELDPVVDNISYMAETYNSMVKNVNDLGIDEVSLQSSIETIYSSIPNQYKAMFVLAASQKRNTLGTGFDAVRPLLEESDTAMFKDSISYISENSDFPPYQTTRDPMKTYAKFLAFWMNYKQIGVIEYLSNFENLDTSSFGVTMNSEDPSYSRKPLRPVWKKFTPDFYNGNSGTNFLCRVRNISKSDIVEATPQATPGNVSKINKGVDVDRKDLFDLPIYNRYFMLRGQ
jgi:hypothetical protein